MKTQKEKEKKYIELNDKYRRKLFFGIDFEIFEERAAIREFDGNVSFEIAAESAFKEIIKKVAYEFKI